MLSAALTIWQLSQKSEVVTESALVFARDVARGEVLQASDFVEIQVLPDTCVEGMLTSAQEAAGAYVLLDLPRGVVAIEDFFEHSLEPEIEKGYAMTAIKMSPDSAICWTSEAGSILSVCFVDDEGALTELGEVKLLDIFDQRLGKDDVPVFAVVTGKKTVIEQIVQRRTLGRLEVLIKK